MLHHAITCLKTLTLNYILSKCIISLILFLKVCLSVLLFHKVKEVDVDLLHEGFLLALNGSCTVGTVCFYMEVRIEFVPGTDRILPLEGRRDRMSQPETFYVLLIVAL